MPNRLLQAGFTTIELIMVMVIIGVLAAVAAAKWPTNIEARPTALQLVEDIRLAQSLSMNRGGGFSIERTATDQYRLLDGGTLHGTARTTEASLADFTLRFDGLGRPTDGGGTPLTSDTTINVAGGTASVTVRAQTGLAEVSP